MKKISCIIVTVILLLCITAGCSKPEGTRKLSDIVKRVLRGEYFYPATHALWFYAPKTGDSCKNKWYDQALAGRYKNHCFYNPDSGVCVELY